jgi:hypothetical protein
MCLCVRTTNASKKRTGESAERPSKRVKPSTLQLESLRVLLLALEILCLHDETGSQRTTRRQNDVRSRAHRTSETGAKGRYPLSQPGYHQSSSFISTSPRFRVANNVFQQALMLPKYLTVSGHSLSCKLLGRRLFQSLFGVHPGGPVM